MRKTNWIVLAVLVVASIGFLALWYGLGLNAVDSPTDLALTIAWWVAVVAVIVAITMAESKRRQSIRMAFLAPGVIYNPEAGTVKVASDASPVAALQSVLSRLSYPDSVKGAPTRSGAKYTHIVSSKKFANDGATWEGEVMVVSRPDDAPRAFSSRAELLSIVEGA